MRNLVAVLLVFLSLSMLVGCSRDERKKSAGPSSRSETVRNSTAPHVFQSIPPAEALKMINSRKNLLVIDVRNPDELRNGEIKGAHLVPMWNFARGEYLPPAGRPILVVCAVGGRSDVVGRFLAGKGYAEVYSLKGGIAAWKAAGLPLQYPREKR